MSRGRQSLVVWIIAGLAFFAIGAGLAITGGPLQGRKERRDMVRYQDLTRLSQQAICLFGANELQGTQIGSTDTCPDDARLLDPYTQEPYRIEALDPRHLRLCASFELAEKEAPWVRRYSPQWQGDCLVVELEPDVPAK